MSRIILPDLGFKWQDFACKHFCPRQSTPAKCGKDFKKVCDYRNMFNSLICTDVAKMLAENIATDIEKLAPEVQTTVAARLSENILVEALRAKGFSGELRRDQVAII